MWRMWRGLGFRDWSEPGSGNILFTVKVSQNILVNFFFVKFRNSEFLNFSIIL